MYFILCEMYETLIKQRFACQTHTSCHGTCTNISMRD